MLPHDTPQEDIGDLIADELVPIAAELAVAVREHGPEEIARIIAKIPPDATEAMFVVFAAMVEPNASAKALLGWTEGLLPDATELERARLRSVSVSEPAATLLAEFVTRDDMADLDPAFAASIAHLRGQARKDALKKHQHTRRQRERRALEAADAAVQAEIAEHRRTA